MPWKVSAKATWPVDLDTPWDGAAAKREIREWATTDGEFDAARAGQCYLWRNTDDDTADGLVGPLCRIVDGEPMLNAGCVTRGMGRMMQADVPDEILAAGRLFMEKMRARVEKERKQAGKALSEDEAEADDDTNAPPMTLADGIKRLGVADAVKALSPEDRSVSIMVSTEVPDRVDEVMIAAGCQLDNYLRNPVVLWNHNDDMFPIAQAPGTERVVGVGLAAKWLFSGLPFAEQAYQLYREKTLRAASIRYKTLVPPTPQQIGGRPVWVNTAWELLEQSAVNIPANQTALAKSFAAGNDVAKSILRAMFPEQFVQESADPEEQVERVKLSFTERVDDYIKRLTGSAEGLRNAARHTKKVGEQMPFMVADIEHALTSLAEVVPAKELASVLGLAVKSQDHAADPAENVPTQAQTDVPDGALSEQQVVAMTTALASLRTDLHAMQARKEQRIEEIARQAVRDAQRKSIAR